MENQESKSPEVVADQAKVAVKTKFKPVIELDKTGPFLHISIPDYNSWIELYINDVKFGAYRVVEGQVSIQLSGLPDEYRFRAEVLKNK